MKIILIALLVLCLAAPVPCHAIKVSNEIADITYLLRCFSGTTADQAFSSGQVLNTPAEGCLDGQLTIPALESCYAASSNMLVTTKTGNCWNPVGRIMYSTSIPVNMGTSFLATVKIPDTVNSEVNFGFLVAGSETTYDDSYFYGSGVALYAAHAGISGSPTLGLPLTINTTAKYVTVLGGHDSSGVPYKTGDTKSSYKYGYSTYIQRSIDANYILLWRDSIKNTVNVTWYDLPKWNDISHGLQNVIVPNYDFSSVLQPTHLSLFGTDGELSAFTPEVGSGWTENTGDWDTAAGKVVNTTAGIATFDSGLTTALYDAKLTMPAAGTTGGGMVARFVDTTHYWKVEAVVGSSNNVKLIEVNGSEPGDARSTASATLNASTEYRFRLIVSAALPYWTVFVSDATKGSYNTVGSSSTGTRFGLYDGGDANFTGFDVVALFARTSATYTSEFAKVGY